MDYKPFTLSQLMEMRQGWIADNEPLVIARARQDIYEGIIDSFVFQGLTSYKQKIPREFYNFPKYTYLVGSLLAQLQLLFPDLVFKFADVGPNECGTIYVSIQ